MISMAPLSDKMCIRDRVVGEIIAGLVIGPCLLNLVQPSDSIAIFAEIGVVLLMFTPFYNQGDL